MATRPSPNRWPRCARVAEGSIESLPRRAFLLALLLSAAGVILLHPTMVVVLGARWLGPAVLFGLPVLAAILSLLIVPRRLEAPGRRHGWQGTAVLALSCVFAFACAQAADLRGPGTLRGRSRDLHAKVRSLVAPLAVDRRQDRDIHCLLVALRDDAF